MSKVLTDQIEKRTGGTAIDVPATGKWPQGNIADDAIGADQLAADAVGTAALSATGTASATTFLRGDNAWATVDTAGLEADIALLAFKTQANGNLARYNLLDQSVDAFEDASGVDASASTGELRNAASKYYSGGAAGTVTGGTITTHGNYTVHSFLIGANFVTDVAGSADVLVIAGGGAGGGAQNGGSRAGGGGAGGVRQISSHPIAIGTYAVSVGAGATGSPDSGPQGGNSVFNSITATGGGGGGYSHSNGQDPGSAGGSGGGGATRGSAAGGGAGNTPSTTPAQGYPGADASGGGASQGAGGGGGAGAAGPVYPNGAAGGPGGAGISNDWRTGSNVEYGGGGGGGSLSSSGPGGSGGGGAGGGPGGGSNGTANTGGGGGGAGDAGNGGNGGTGIVVVRYLTSSGFTSYNNMTLVSNSVTAQAQPTKADVVLTYTNGAGTAVVNTDLIASVSRDNGTTYTATTLASQGTTGGHTILTANDVDISGQPAGTSMVWKVATTSQSAAKETRIHAVSLGWS